MNTTDPIRALLDEVADMSEAHVSPYPGHAEAWGEFLDRIGTALAQPPEPAEGPSDEEIAEFVEAVRMPYIRAACQSGTPMPDDFDVVLVRATIARRTTPRPTPIPVAERPPGSGDYHPEGDWCWGWYSYRWRMMDSSCFFAGGEATHWLPWWALPLPEVKS